MPDNVTRAETPEWVICENINRTLPFYVTEMGDVKYRKTGFAERQDRDGYFLIFTLAGSGKLTVKGKSIDLKKNNMILTDSCSCCDSDDESWHFIWMKLDGSGVRSYATLLSELHSEGVPIVFRDSLIRDIHYIALMARRSDMISMVQISNTLSEILSTLLTQRLSSQLTSTKENSHYNDIHSAVEYIRTNYTSDINLNDITAHVNISKYYFIRLFREQMGVTPYEYMINYRIYRAKILLRSTNESINKISSAVGFSSPSNFIKHFKRAEGISPACYRHEFDQSPDISE